MDSVECVVIGAGVVGIAIARSLALSGKEVLVLEAEKTFGQGSSSRSSEVIHAGIYYPHGSFMARMCVEGRDRLYRFCREYHVEHKACGKLIVATSADEAAKLPSIAAHARANGVDDVVPIEAERAREMEPHLRAVSALYSPSTGIIDSHGFMLSMVGHAEENGAIFSYETPLKATRITPEIVLNIGGKEPMALSCRWLINCAGLAASRVAGSMEGFPQAFVPETYLAKGNYFALSGMRAPFSRLIYPVPVAGGLGIHLTLDLAGQARFGPDVEWLDEIDYNVNIARSSGFYEAIRRYWPELPDGSLIPAYAGIRPKIVPPAIAKQDFQILGPEDHGVPGVIQLFGIESPGLTASLAIADYIDKRVVGD
ncbi:FAD-dependent oxidoreductase [Brucella endophytica]|uniref:FAD-dependent oxidoreductase n=1 Tax=Brucella endophytica TaxID=1963359 RepID=A0A916SR76_9HYPH|nr:NAD(P)/FAD-dependent oxidoreductase [Brucella endophytica]GGB12388.1 FAD-dependent oxidoreductase [Brucella endophytica]